MGNACAAPPTRAAQSERIMSEGAKSDASLKEGTVTLGECFWESRAARISSLATALFTIAVFTLLAHNPTLGSFYCPLSQCEQNKRQHSTHETIQAQNVVFAIVCFFFDIFIIAFHVTHPVHPKFIVTRFRKRVIYTHIISGMVQVTLGPVIWVSYKFYDAQATTEALIKVLVIWCVLFHVTTACFLARTPFGTVRVMIPSFIMVIGMYCYTLGELWNNEYIDIEAPLLSWWLMTHIYVMNRIVFSVLANLNLLADSRYTLSILLGTAICTPSALGVSMMIYIFCAIVVFNVTYVVTHKKSEELTEGRIVSAGGDAVVTKIKDHFVAPEGAVFAKSLKNLGADHLTKKEIALLVFRQLDIDNSGQISLVDLANLIISWGLPSWSAKDMLRERDSNGDGLIDEQEFIDNFEDVWEFAATVVLGNVHGVTDGRRAGALIQVNDGHVSFGA